MLHISPYLRYLAIPSGYGPTEGLRWARNGEAIETPEGKTLIFAAMLPPFLEGFAAHRPLIHFVYILDLLHLLGHRDEPWEGMPRRQCMTLREVFRSLGTPLRNAGAFFGTLCKDVPTAYLPGYNDRDLAHWLTAVPALMMKGWENPEKPPLDAVAFHRLVSQALEKVSEAQLRHWLRFGRAPLWDEGERLAEEVVNVKPPAFRGTLDDLLRQRPRLAGALPLVEKMVSALALPPRRRAAPELPLGGYADVTNRGEPERLLPSQFALEGDEFVRRFAEKELLFFRKEEPHQRTREQLVLLVDQGVRTWGVVRLALSAAAVAFHKLAERKKRSFRMRFSSAVHERIDPAQGDLPALADRLEASELSANPTDLLEAEVNDDDCQDADIVLLTHPRSLQDDDVKRAAGGLPDNKRLFALAVDDEGAAQFSQLRHGEPVPITRFRVNFRDSEVPPVPLPADDSLWTGDVEPVPFPFPIEPFRKIVALGFDAEARRLLVASQRGYLHLWKLEGGELETLPRGCHDDEILMVVDAVLGVRNGFVVGGKMGFDLAAVHYDLRRRHVKLHRLGPAADGWRRWYGFAEIEAVAVRQIGLCRGLHLATGAMYAEPERPPETNARAQHAYLQALEKEVAPPWIPACVEGPALVPPRSPFLTIVKDEGQLNLFNGGAAQCFRVIENGKPVVFQGAAFQAQLADGVIAFAFQRSAASGFMTWRLFATANTPGPLLGEYELPSPGVDLCQLAPDGKSFAMPRKHDRVIVRAVGEGGTNRLVTGPSRLHHNVLVYLGKTSMNIVIGRKRHSVCWREGPLAHRFERMTQEETLDGTLVMAGRVRHPFTSFDPHRFAATAIVDLEVFVEVTGQVVVRDPHRQRLVCIFFPMRDQLAAWMPDGTRLGPSHLIGGPATPDALERLGAALRRASSPVEA